MKLPDIATLRRISVEQLITIIGQAIVRQGGHAVDSNEQPIYASRVDSRMVVDLYDPELGRAVHVMAKVRVTIEREI